MSDESEASVIGSLPHSRPQLRSDKRAARSAPKRAAAAKPGPAQQSTADQSAPARPRPDRAAEAAGTPVQHERCGCPASLADPTELLGTLARAAVEVAEIGLTIGARALRNAVSRLPKP